MSVNFVTQIDNVVKIKRVLVSVSNKTGLEKLIPGLIEVNPEIHFYSTGGTFAYISELLGPDKAAKYLTQVSDYTGQPETQGGLVKTLDFKIYLGLLTETYNESHKADLERTGAQQIDMVIVNLYPFREAIAKENATIEHARANIDIGGPCMVRASAKNYLRVAAITNPSDYSWVLDELKKSKGSLDLAQRFELAQQAFAYTADYDDTIAGYLAAAGHRQVGSCYTFKDK